MLIKPAIQTPHQQDIVLVRFRRRAKRQGQQHYPTCPQNETKCWMFQRLQKKGHLHFIGIFSEICEQKLGCGGGRVMWNSCECSCFTTHQPTRVATRHTCSLHYPSSGVLPARCCLLAAPRALKLNYIDVDMAEILLKYSI